jgi:flagellar biogenesis protein FliO
MSPLGQYIVQTGMTLLGIALLAWLVLVAGRRIGLPREDENLRLRATLRLDARRSVYLVEVAGRVLVVAAGEGGISKLAELPSDSLRAEPRSPSTFREALSRVRAGWAKPSGEAPDESPERESR